MSDGRRDIVRMLGWVLTPFVVWAAAFAGGWLGAVVGHRWPVLLGGIGWIVGGAVVGGGLALTIWIRRLRAPRRAAAADPQG